MVVHRKGYLHIDADFLSRNLVENAKVYSLLQIETAQSSDATTRDISRRAQEALGTTQRHIRVNRRL